MLVHTTKGILISTIYNNETITLNDSLQWSIWLKRVRNVSTNTIHSYMKSMDRFWIWSLYNPVEYNERFPSYQARYREAMRNGFRITFEEFDHESDSCIELEVLSSEPLEKITINKELAGINSYFYFTQEHELLYDHRFINHLYEKQRKAKSFLSSIEIKSSRLAQKAFAEHLKYLPPYKIPKNRQEVKYFPVELYDTLLSVAQPRDKLIYLLCGACSARIGQALNLTLYDIDFDKLEVWLIDPKSDEKDIYGNKRREWLKHEYDIDMLSENCEHNKSDLQFKYPIPFTQTSLFWINEQKYKRMFFETLVEYKNSKAFVSETLRTPRHPFLFTTYTGKRIRSRDTLSRFKSNMRKVVLKSKTKHNLSKLGLHSLRHMFGHTMAEIYAKTGDDSLIKITQDAMGHSSLDSTLVYFNISSKTMKEAILKASNQIYKDLDEDINNEFQKLMHDSCTN
ncbi:tyrosine-type recombinase/integrase [Aliarcobacter butzleri]|uniref:tyrosine-type recombinase/integrase n=1 Tax=Aliarcobacter butzleri TaxID=28197 RepID=UPI003B20D548